MPRRKDINWIPGGIFLDFFFVLFRERYFVENTKVHFSLSLSNELVFIHPHTPRLLKNNWGSILKKPTLSLFGNPFKEKTPTPTHKIIL
jgi:hypothetical protein